MIFTFYNAPAHGERLQGIFAQDLFRDESHMPRHLLTKCLTCRGGMIFTFYKARGMAVGSSLVEEDKLDLAKKLEEAAKAKGVEFILPTDVVIADKFDENANNKVVSASEIPDGWMVRLVPTQPAAFAASRQP